MAISPIVKGKYLNAAQKNVTQIAAAERWLGRAGRIHLQPFDEILEVWNAKTNIPAGSRAQLPPFREMPNSTSVPAFAWQNSSVGADRVA